MTKRAPGRSEREGMSLVQVVRKFNSEEKAARWFVKQRWGRRIICSKCNSENIQTPTTHPDMPFRCRACRKFFSVKTGTPMEGSNLPLSKWAIGLYLYSTNLKGVSSMKLHRDLDIAQKAAWHVAHRIREMYNDFTGRKFDGPVEVDETYIGGKEKWKHEWKKQNAGGGPVGKSAVVGMKDRATNQVSASVVDATDGPTLTEFVHERTMPDTTVVTDDARAYRRLRRPHLTVKHSVKEFVNGMAHTNGLESQWALFKRGYVGTYRHFNAKHLVRYVREFTGRHNCRPLDTEQQMAHLVRSGEGKRLRLRELIGGKATRRPPLHHASR